jgi:peptidoglycan/LPS O-acetylase OafA/YrhL
MMDCIELALGFALPFLFMVLGYWQKEVWLFVVSSVMWLVLMGFLFNSYTTSDYFYYIAWMCLALGIVCATAQLWMDKDKPMTTKDIDKEK